MQIIQHQDKRSGAPPEGGREDRGGPAQRGYAQSADIGDQPGSVREQPDERRSQDGEQDAGIVVEPVERNPAQHTILGAGPLATAGWTCRTQRGP